MHEKGRSLFLCLQPSRRRRDSGVIAAAIVAATTWATWATPGTALACARDGIPSVSANGRLAVLNKTGGSARLLPAAYAPFVFATSVRAGRPVTLSENNYEVAQALPRAFFSRPWRWAFGDGSRTGSGAHVRHIFTRPGDYRITVLAYYPGYAAWQPFDLVMIHVR